ncbi:radical SAM protein [Yinghuangia sp. ASG 101]|uniref:coproporphyrinogen-III oxidase family protein n=1 Tax=Yinghuangia sp. ASG 101 TaxID=2896848 RepID=UPI001E3EBD71|nr:radical SAM protein [Yinghuangia sp. ASG 101]UGQ12165.1 radical SAM protein [Yinghuangia sp. ASG 101]
MLDSAFVKEYLDTHLEQRQVNKVQHGFPSPRYWNEPSVPMDELTEDRRRLQKDGRQAGVYLYVGVPYCIKTTPGKCGYCLFPVEEFQGNDALEDYYGYVEREAELYRDLLEGSVLTTAYFGGGTSNLYRPHMYHKIMDLVRGLVPEIAPTADVTLEGIPQLFTRDKMRAIRDSGMNRISMGVQQVNERLNSLSGRRQTTRHVVQSLEWAREFGLAANVDVIFGWPQQTVQTMLEDLETLVSWGVHDITHYELNVGGPTDFALNRFHELPSTLSNLEMYREGRDLLLDRGYEQHGAYSFRKPGDPTTRLFREGYRPETSRDTSDAVGLGYAAVSFFGDASLGDGRSWSFINQRNLTRYKQAVDDGRFPVERAFRHQPEDWLLATLFRKLLGMEIDRTGIRRAMAVDVYEEFATIWDALAERGLVEIEPDRITLVGDGPFYTPLISTLLAEERYHALRDHEARTPKTGPVPAGGTGPGHG